LGRAIDPPKVAALSGSWKFLKEIGAINEDDTITALGRAMVRSFYFYLPSYRRLTSPKATLPVDIKLAKVSPTHTGHDKASR